jgi:hypothetical protein
VAAAPPICTVGSDGSTPDWDDDPFTNVVVGSPNPVE